MNLAPIILFTYNRPEHTKKALDSLKKNELAGQSKLIVFIDGPKNEEDSLSINKIHSFLKKIDWIKEVEIHRSKENLGLKKSILNGVTTVINTYGKAIILEDDIEISPGFLEYMNSALSLYENNKTVMHISGYVPETYFNNLLPNTFFHSFMSCWGWATWKDRWDLIELDIDKIIGQINDNKKYFNINNTFNLYEQIKLNKHGTINTWAIFWYASIFINKGLCLYPKKSVVRNIGLDGTGVHYNKIKKNDPATIENLLEKVVLEKQQIKKSILAEYYYRFFYFFGKYPSYKDILYRIYYSLK